MTALRTVSCPLPCLLDCLLACLTLTSNRHLDCYRSSRRVNLAVTCHCHRSFFSISILSCLTAPSDTLKSIGGESKLFRLGSSLDENLHHFICASGVGFFRCPVLAVPVDYIDLYIGRVGTGERSLT